MSYPSEEVTVVDRKHQSVAFILAAFMVLYVLLLGSVTCDVLVKFGKLQWNIFVFLMFCFGSVRFL